MTWTITHKQSFLNDLVNLSKEWQQRVVRAVADLQNDPITWRGNTIKPLKGWDNVYRYRIGDHCLLYTRNSKLS